MCFTEKNLFIDMNTCINTITTFDQVLWTFPYLFISNISSSFLSLGLHVLDQTTSVSNTADTSTASQGNYIWFDNL